MELIFKETCAFCDKEYRLSEYQDFYEGDIYVDPVDGTQCLTPTWAKNKSTAKKFFKLEGWQYYKGLVFCKDCFEHLNNEYVVIDRFNQFYNADMTCDTPDPSFLMTLDEAVQFTAATYNNEVVRSRKALRIVCQLLKGEWTVDVVGHHKAHPETTITIASPNF